MQAEPDLLESCALGVIYALGVLSFHDARPRGNSGMDFAEKDDWTVADLLRGLRRELTTQIVIRLVLRRRVRRSCTFQVATGEGTK